MASSENEKEGWKNPQDIMRIHRIQRRNSIKSNLKMADEKNSQQMNGIRKRSSPNDGKPDINPFKKRRNPFASEKNIPVKHLKLENNLLECSEKLSDKSSVKESLLTGSVQKRIAVSSSTEQEKQMSVKLQQQHGNVLSELEPNVKWMDSIDHGSENPQTVCSSVPLDWSLKLKMRVVTNTNINSNGKCPGIDARNVYGFVHNQYTTEEWQGMDIVSQIKRCCYHYCFPSIPFMSKFPRLSTHYGNKPSPLDTSLQEILDALQSEWSKAFISIYQQMRSSLCPYFYVCTHQFTVLFRCVRSEEKCVLSAFLSPSTRGLRELLKQEGISFQMPKVKQNKTASGSKTDNVSMETSDTGKEDGSRDNCNSQGDGESISKHNEIGRTPSRIPDDRANRTENDDEDDDDDANSHEDDAATNWLEEIGVESKDFPSLLPQNVKLQKERFQDIDNRLQSVLYMEGLDVHAFSNFLLNYPSCFASSGPQFGLPPTILSPSPFQGGALTVNAVKQSILQDAQGIKQMGINQVKDKGYVLEINGPILPHHTLNIATILQAKASRSSLSFSVFQPSTTFNTDIEERKESNIMTSGLSKLLVPFSSLNLGLLQNVKESLLSKECTSLKEIIIEKKGISLLN